MFINKAEILGKVGSIRVSEIEDQKMAKLTVVTQHVSKNSDGEAVIINDWHYVSMFNGAGIADVESIKPGDMVHIHGRLRTQAYVRPDGDEVRMTEIFASKVELIPGSDEEHLQR